MNANDFVFLGLHSSVTALNKSDGKIAWSTSIRAGGLGGTGFVILACDDERIYAYASGWIHCLSLLDGRLLWSNGLEGFGYGIGSLCLHGFPPSSVSAALAAITAQQQAAQSAAVT